MNVKTHITPNWPAPNNIHAFTTLRYGLGVSKAPFDQFNLGNRYSEQGDNPAIVEKNRQQLVQVYALPSQPHWLKQVHGTHVQSFEREAKPTGDFHVDEPNADAAYTAKKNVVLSILSADCLPVLFCDVSGTEIAAAHAGWRGLAAGMLENTTSSMQSAPENILAWLGPAAGPKAYEVGIEVRDAFLAHDKNAEIAFTPTREGHWWVDLYQLARMRLQAVGVNKISGGDHCTLTETDKFFSHRREQRTGRMASVIWME